MVERKHAGGGAFDTAPARVQYEDDYHKLRAGWPRLANAVIAERFIQLESELDAGMIDVKSALLTSALLSTEDDASLGTWIHHQHRELMKLGARAVEECAIDPKIDGARTMRLLALTFLHWGEAVKWELMVGRHELRDYRLLHGLMRIAIDKKRFRESGELVVDGVRRWASIEHLYWRTLLLDRFTSGSLTREEVEVLDAWIWEWAKSLVSETRYPGVLALRADLDESVGLRQGPRKGKGTSLYLALPPLEDLRKSVIAELHRGRVVPREGRAAAIRIEAHVAVLLQLRNLFEGGGSPGKPRAPRQEVGTAPVEVYVGLGEIVQALQAGKATVIPDMVSAAPVASKKASARSTSDRFTAIDGVYDKAHRYFTPRTSSATGYLFVATEKAAAGVTVGALLGLRIDPREAPVLVRVVRRVVERNDGTHIGVQLLSDPSRPIRVAKLEGPDGKKETHVFVPGPDGSGRFDSFAVTYHVLKDRPRYKVRAGGNVYSLSFNRIRRRGKGWALAGFEILEAASVPA